MAAVARISDKIPEQGNVPAEKEKKENMEKRLNEKAAQARETLEKFRKAAESNAILLEEALKNEELRSQRLSLIQSIENALTALTEKTDEEKLKIYQLADTLVEDIAEFEKSLLSAPASIKEYSAHQSHSFDSSAKTRPAFSSKQYKTIQNKARDLDFLLMSQQEKDNAMMKLGIYVTRTCANNAVVGAGIGAGIGLYVGGIIGAVVGIVIGAIAGALVSVRIILFAKEKQVENCYLSVRPDQGIENNFEKYATAYKQETSFLKRNNSLFFNRKALSTANAQVESCPYPRALAF